MSIQCWMELFHMQSFHQTTLILVPDAHSQMALCGFWNHEPEFTGGKMRRLMRSLLLAIILLSLMALSCGISIDMGENTPAPSETLLPTPTETARSTATPEPSSTPDYVATKSAEDMLVVVERLVRDGFLDSDNGEAMPLPDITIASAELGIRQKAWDGDVQLENFVMKVDLLMETASDSTGWGGCGIAFRTQENDDRYEIFLANETVFENNYYRYYFYLDGFVYQRGHFAGEFIDWESMGRVPLGPAVTRASTNMLLVVQGNTIRIFLDGLLIKSYTGFAYQWMTGRIGYVIQPTTSTDFGTRCTYTNGVLWVLKP